MRRLLCLLLILHALPLTAATTTPATLEQWRPWLLERHPDIDCPRLALQLEQQRCVWPGRLTLEVGDSGGRFEQRWLLRGRGWVPLPGDREHWPLDVTANGRPAAVLARDDLPALWLEPGDYTLRGSLAWREPPQALAVPAGTALLSLTRNGRPVPQPDLDADSRLWLQRRVAAVAGTGSTVKAEVFRKIVDTIPREVVTVLRLSVAGKPRELLLGRMLPADAEPVSFSSPLPARLENDGNIRIQARAGQWRITLRARLLDDVNRFQMERRDDTWPAQEVWAFAADQALRRVRVSGVPTLDPSQLDLPPGFGGLPAFLLTPGKTLVLEQQYRGDAAPAANELTLNKTVWLDFDGTGATVLDHISGHMAQGWRLDAQPAQQLGRVTVNGEPQVVTRALRGDAAGVEIRNARVDMQAVSRLERLGGLPASGWQADFRGENLDLRLPPGWKLWHASGPDSVYGSWLSHWNLWNIFLALLIVGGVFRLLGRRWAVVGLAAVLLAYHEDGSPILYFLPLLAVLALLKVAGSGRLRRAVLLAGYGFGLILALVLIAFAVDQVRRGIYPQLDEQGGGRLSTAAVESAKPAPPPDQRLESVVAARKSAAPTVQYAPPIAQPRQRYQPEANVQTGPGQPVWSWRLARLHWSGPVKADQALHLYLSGPWITRLLKFLEVILVAALAWAVVRALRSGAGRDGTGGASGESGAGSGAAALALLLAGAMAHPPQAIAGDFPPQYLLKEYESRLTQPPACQPDCAAIESAAAHIAGDQLGVRLRVGVAAAVAVPLPRVDNWQPRSVLVDGVAAPALQRDGQNLLLPLSPGRHDVTLEGPVSGDELALQFALPPHAVSVSAEDWDVFGVSAGRLVSNTLQLQKRRRAAREDTLLPAPAKPFVRVARALHFDLDWTATTTVTRVAPQRGAINLDIPLLPGESVISPGVETHDGKVAVSLGAGQNETSWESVLKPAAQLTLSAARTSQWVESWSATASSRWHLEGSGLPPIKSDDPDVALRWLPWPGETLHLSALRPAPVKGATTTVEHAALQLSPGARSGELLLRLQINSSVGGDYRVQLAQPAALKQITINGAEVTQLRGDDKLLLPLYPGRNRVEIRWELQSGIRTWLRTPALQLDSPANNIELELQLPRDRWPLWLSGPSLGPAMLYWGVLVVIAAAALGLGALCRRQRLSIPLRAWQWLLLGIGMSTVTAAGSVVVVLWFFALEWRRRVRMPAGRFRYNAVQIGLVLLTLAAALCLFSTIPQSLLSAPDMQVAGNDSHNYLYRWYQDRSAAALPRAAVFSLPLWVYRIAMLVWSLWLVFALLRWVQWGWQAFAAGAAWRARAPAAPPPAA